jgi:hypothetical protein
MVAKPNGNATRRKEVIDVEDKTNELPWVYRFLGGLRRSISDKMALEALLE